MLGGGLGPLRIIIGRRASVCVHPPRDSKETNHIHPELPNISRTGILIKTSPFGIIKNMVVVATSGNLYLIAEKVLFY